MNYNPVKLVVICIAAFYSFTMLAQNSTIDSLQKRLEIVSVNEKPVVLNNLAEEFLKLSDNKAEILANEAIVLSQKNNDVNEEAHGYKIKSSCYINFGRIEEALFASKRALEIYLRNGKLKNVAEVYNQLGIIYKQKRDFYKSQESFTKAIEYYGMVRDSSGIARAKTPSSTNQWACLRVRQSFELDREAGRSFA